MIMSLVDNRWLAACRWAGPRGARWQTKFVDSSLVGVIYSSCLNTLYTDRQARAGHMVFLSALVNKSHRQKIESNESSPQKSERGDHRQIREEQFSRCFLEDGSQTPGVVLSLRGFLVEMIRRNISSSLPVSAFSRDGARDDNGKRQISSRQPWRDSPTIKRLVRRLKSVTPLVLILIGARQVLRAILVGRKLGSVVGDRASVTQRPLVIQLGSNVFDDTSSISFQPFNKTIDGYPLGEEWKGEECTPMHAWQLPEFGPSSCNKLHELSMDSLTLLNCGTTRCAFELHDIQGHSVVLKMPK